MQLLPLRVSPSSLSLKLTGTLQIVRLLTRHPVRLVGGSLLKKVCILLISFRLTRPGITRRLRTYPPVLGTVMALVSTLRTLTMLTL